MSAPKFPANGSDNDTFGTEELCTWPIGPGVCRFQTRSPKFAGKLGERAGAKLTPLPPDKSPLADAIRNNFRRTGAGGSAPSTPKK